MVTEFGTAVYRFAEKSMVRNVYGTKRLVPRLDSIRFHYTLDACSEFSFVNGNNQCMLCFVQKYMREADVFSLLLCTIPTGRMTGQSAQSQ